jgi:hypothetical protein
MGRTTTLTTAAQTVAMYAALSRHADAACAAGDPRTRGQIMADTVVERVTGQVTATDVPVAIGLLMTDADLLAAVADRMGSAPTAPRTDDSDLPASDADDSADDPDAAIAESDGTALLGGYGPVPAALAREWVFAPRDAVPRWLRRLYTAPGSGELIAMDSRRRLFTPGQRAFIAARDQVCRTPWCGAPIRQIDHIVAAGRGGPTAVANGQGLCQACDNAKQAPGWGAVPAPPGRAGPHTVTLTTPTGHRYVSRAPDLPSGRGRPRRAAAPLAPERLRTPPAVRSPVERVAVDLFFGDPRRSRCWKADAA